MASIGGKYITDVKIIRPCYTNISLNSCAYMLCAIYLRMEVNVKIQPQFMLVLFQMLYKNGGIEKICFSMNTVLDY